MIGAGRLPFFGSAPWSPALLSPFLWYTASPAYCFSDAGGTTPCADGDSVYVWKDKSGNARDLSQSTSGSRPVMHATGDGGYHLTFDGTDDTMSVNLGATLTQPCTVGSRTDGGRPWENAFSSRQLLLIQAGFGSAIFAGSLIGPGATNRVAGTYHNLVGIFDGASSSVRVDGVAEASGDAGTNSQGDLTLNFDGTSHFASQLRHLLAFPSAVSGASLTSLESWLGTALA